MDGKGKIFIVDDEIGVLNSLRRLLRKGGYEISIFENAEYALTEMAKDPPHLVISDFKMPGMDGVSLFRRVEECYPSIVKILMSGFSDLDDVLAESGIDIFKFIAKPWDDAQFKKVVADAFISQGREIKEGDIPDGDLGIDAAGLESFWSDDEGAFRPVDILNAIPFAVVAVGPEGGIEFTNRAGNDLCLKEDKPECLDVNDLFHGSVFESFRQSIYLSKKVTVDPFEFGGEFIKGRWVPVAGKGAVFIAEISGDGS